MTPSDATGAEQLDQDAADLEAAPPDTAATYLARWLCAERGYRPGTAPEAADLAAASDLVLTKANGFNFQVVCILDRDRCGGAARDLGLSREALVAIGAACATY